MGPPLHITLFERLSSLVRPVNYKLLLKPNLDTGIFQGNVKINIVIKQEKNYVNLHSKFLDISKVQVFRGDREIPVFKYMEVEKLEQLLIEFNDPLSPGSYQIDIDFEGKLTQKIVGFYSSRLRDGKTMVASKFQPTYARQAFPCFDEPDFKATYDITLVKPENYVALSNMNEISRSHDNTTSSDVVTFATSVPMSTYLACFVICDFASKETEINSSGIGSNFILRSFAQKDQTHKIDFAQSIGKRATEFYIQYYEVPFPLPKLDMIAIPDYISGATEHWGLVTYRETSFLVDEATASAQNKVSVANTIAHELAHMWFGNLVTMKWWDDLWLNEGFASYMQVKCLNAIEPSWTMLDQFLKGMHSVMVTDAKLSSHPIVQTVDTPDQITAIFDSISYNKGSSVLRMLEGFIGEENFRRGVSDYLKKHKFGNTVTQDLLASLEPYFKKDNPDLNLTYIMDTWTRQMGYPVLTVSKTNTTYRVTQSRFLLDPEATSPNDSDYNYRWFVPVTYKTNNGVNEKVIWFGDKKENVEISEPDATWLKINNNQVGYYRVNYPQEMWQSLVQQLKARSDQLTISDRSHLLDDVSALASAGLVPYSLGLDLTTYLSVEEAYMPWQTAAGIFGHLSLRLLNTPAHDDLKLYMQELVKPIFSKVDKGSGNLGVIERLLRTTILSLATKAELPEAQSKVRQMFLEWLNSHDAGHVKTVETDLRALVYYHGMKQGTQEEWDKLWQIYKREEDVHEQSKIRQALAAPRDTNILRKYLDLAWDETNVRAQDYLNVIQMISNNPSGTALIWEDVRNRWPSLVERYTLNSRYLGALVPGITDSFNSEREIKEMEDFFAKYPEAGAGTSARQRALETVRNNIKWAANRAPAVNAWLQQRRGQRSTQKS
ncbi:glutamyl aminopeptidase-like isoform X2 [Cydia pomonella]|uniref:glutamyl aminopeptidase-like isoform X2 n=1 Tax=Cydia pomonella TaxID=82600 RepID=UPI002ADE57D2|nr:glutamyl aminopeptidase-like isoform X2 [Cydia pomonella]